MELGFPGRGPVWGQTLLWWFCCAVFPTAGAADEMSHSHATLAVSVPHVFYTCPEGATAKLVCTQKGAPMHSTDYLKTKWLFTPDIAQHCSGRVGPRHSVVDGHTHDTHGLKYGSAENNFWVILPNVTHEDQGRYCCVVLDFQIDHKHGKLVHRPHNHVLLQVTSRTNGSQECTILDPKAPGGSAPVALAIAACILALLSLPLILVLVYKQRQNAQSSRRAQELVRMDSETAYGHENPVFLGESPQTKTRTVSQIMTRQSSETGRHLLSEPGTPLSPPAHGDVFFPREDTIPESPPFLQL